MGVIQDWCAAVEAPGRRGCVEGQRAASAGQTGAKYGGSAHKCAGVLVLVYLTPRPFQKNETNNNNKWLALDYQNPPLDPNWTGRERGSAFPVRDLLLQLLRSV